MDGSRENNPWSPANYITLLRIFLVPFFFTELVSYKPGQEHHRWIALIIFAIAALTDALDGFLARYTKTRTHLGKFLDPLADKLLLLSGFIGLLFVEALPYRPPLWLTVTIVFRDIVVVLGLIVLFLTNGILRIEPNLLGKSTTACQMITLIAILLNLQVAIVFWYATAILTILSCLVYMARELKGLKN
jgi:cardiolipin synthase (CMP-forming)